MAKVRGPGFSFRARGTVAGTQYRKTSRGNVVLQYKNKPVVVSAPQAVVRACMSSLAALYQTLSGVKLSAWRADGTAFDFRWGAFAYFTYVNMPRCRADLPLLSWPPAGVLSSWEVDVDDCLTPGDALPGGVLGLWFLVNAPSLESYPGVDVLFDSLWEVDGVGDVMPIEA